MTVIEGDGTPGVATKNFQVTFQLAPGTFTPAGQATFLWETVNTGSATEGVDYPYARSVDPGTQQDLPVTMPIPDPGEQPVTRVRTLKIYGDTEEEVDETFEVHILNPSSNIDLADGIGVVTIEDNDGPPEISIDDVTAAEGGNATVTLSLDTASNQQIDVQLDTADGSAVAPGDYTPAAAQIVNFPVNTTTATFDIPLIDDGTSEGTEDFTVNLSNPVNANIADNQATVTITDLQSQPQLSIADMSVVEGDDTFKSVILTITLDVASSQQVDFTFRTENGTATGGTESPADFQRVNGAPFFFAPGETVRTASVKIFGDTDDEGDEEFTANLLNPVNATLLDGQATVTIIDNDAQPQISIDDLTVLEGDGSTPADFVLADATLSLDFAPNQQVDVEVDSADGTAVVGTDYEAVVDQVVSFPANTTTATVTVKVFSNDVEDGNRDFTLNLSNPVNGTILDGTGVVTIDDNEDPPAVSVADLSVTEGDGVAPNDFVNADVTVSLDGPAGADFTVELDTADGSATAGTDYEALVDQVVTIPAGSTSVTQSIKVFGDFAVEGDEDFTVALSNQSANATLGDAGATVTIVDNDVIPDISITGVTVTEGDTGFQFAMLSLSLSQAATTQVDVELDSSDGTATAPSDYEAIVDQVVSFTPGATTATAFVKVFGDLAPEPTEDLTVALSNPVNGVIVGGPATVTINDQDSTPQISIADASITEGDGSAPNDFVTLDLTLTTDIVPQQTVTVELTTADGSATAGADYEALNGALATFTAGNDTTNVSVDIYGDSDFEGNETFTVSLANPVNGAILDGSATVTIIDNELNPGLPNLRVEDVYVTEGDANQGNVELVFVLEEAVDTTVRAMVTMEDITATSGAGAGDGDYVPIIDLLLVFSPGDRILKRVVKINGDSDYEGNETARIVLSPNTTPTTSDDVNIIDGEGILTILDSEVGPGDGPAIFIADVTQQEGGNVGFNNVEVTFILEQPSGASVFFDVAAADGNTGVNDATLAGGDFVDPTTHLVMPFVFPPGQQIVKKNFRINGDTELEGNEVFRLLVQNPVGGVIGDGEGIVTILDTDLPEAPPTVNVFDVIDGENGDIGTENATIKFFLDRPYDQTVTVQYQPVDDTLTVAEGDYDPNPASPTVSFLPGEQIAEKPVIINRDNTYGGTERLKVVISNPTGGATIGDGEGWVT
ncbi:MAG: Calx-beta domain-containing protein, partial [Acidimicrobiales bacterium]